MDVFVKISGAHEANQKTNFETWNWKIALHYLDLLADICTHSTQTSIKQKCILGFNQNIIDALKQTTERTCNGYALLDAAKFRPYSLSLKSDGKKNRLNKENEFS
jgi:hypothetical protein